VSLKDRLLTDMKEAMKAKEAGKTRLAAIRMVRAAIKNKEIEIGHELAETEVLDIIAREVKLRKESLPDYERSGRGDLIAKLHEEIDVLSAYLPRQLSEKEIEVLVGEAITKVGAMSPKDLGKVMGVVIPKTKGRADGKLVNSVARRLLEQL